MPYFISDYKHRNSGAPQRPRVRTERIERAAVLGWRSLAPHILLVTKSASTNTHQWIARKKTDRIDYLHNKSAWEPHCHLQAASLGQAQQPHIHIIVCYAIILWHLDALRLMMDKILEP